MGQTEDSFIPSWLLQHVQKLNFFCDSLHLPLPFGCAPPTGASVGAEFAEFFAAFVSASFTVHIHQGLNIDSFFFRQRFCDRSLHLCTNIETFYFQSSRFCSKYLYMYLSLSL